MSADAAGSFAGPLEAARGRRNPLASALGIGGIALTLLFAMLLHVFGIPLIAFLPLLGAVLLWILARHPIGGLGIVLALMPIYPLAFLLAKFFGPAYVARFVGCDRVSLLVLIAILWWRNRIRLTVPDWLLLASFSLALVRLAFGGMLIALLNDFNFMIAYAAGRVVLLAPEQEKLWAKRAVWIVAILSVLGMAEVFVIGEGPRTVLYLSVAHTATAGGALDLTFHADEFTGLRESATMFSPLPFASLCMVGLILWWVYCRNLWLGGLVAAGLLCSLTRSGWLGTALALPFLAVLTRQQKRLLVYAGWGLALFIVSIPILGIRDYLSLTKSGQDFSAQGHAESILTGVQYVAAHPLGSGPGTVGPYATENNTSGVFIENTYETLAGEYGIPACLCFVGFLVSALRLGLRERTQLGYVAAGILVGFGAVMMVVPLHVDFPLASWIWFPVGAAVESSIGFRKGLPTTNTMLLST